MGHEAASCSVGGVAPCRKVQRKLKKVQRNWSFLRRTRRRASGGGSLLPALNLCGVASGVVSLSVDEPIPLTSTSLSEQQSVPVLSHPERSLGLREESRGGTKQMNDKSKATLLTHCGARKIDRAGLALLPEPETLGPRHKPIPHHRLIETLTGVLADAHLEIRREEFAVYGERGERLFGVLDLTSSNGMSPWMRPGASFALGLRGSTDESLSISIGIGQRVFVCDNLNMHADHIALTRKNTSGLDLGSELRQAVERYKVRTASFVELLDRARAITLSSERAKSMIFDLFNERTLPICKMSKVAAWYFSPPAEATDVSEFPGTLFSLLQAATRECRDLKPARKFKATTRIGRLLTAV